MKRSSGTKVVHGVGGGKKGWGEGLSRQWEQEVKYYTIVWYFKINKAPKYGATN